MSLPVVLLRLDGDVVPVILGANGDGYDLVRERVVPVDLGKVTGAVNMDPAAVYWGLSIVEEERGETKMAAEADSNAVPSDWVWAYHTTAADNLSSIARHGLRPDWHEHVEDAPVLFVERDVDGLEPYIYDDSVILRFKTPGFGGTDDGEDVLFGGNLPFVGAGDGVIPPDRIQVQEGDSWRWLVAAGAREPDHSCFPPGLRDAREGVQYWDDLSPEEKERHRTLFRQSIDRLKARNFPFEATFMGENVRVLGFSHDFPPYNDGPYARQPYDSQMMVEGADGRRFIALAHSLDVNGQPLAYSHGYKLSPSRFETLLQQQVGGAKEDFLGFGRVSAEKFAATFLANVEGSGRHRAFADDPRTETIAATLRALGVESVQEILGAGSFGTAALLDDETIIKLTSDPSEVQAGSILRGQRLPHVAEVYESFFIRGVRAKTIVAERGNRKVRVKNPVGVLTTERVTPIPEDYAAEQLSETVAEVKGQTKTWPDQLARSSHAEQRARLKRASSELESILREQAEGLDEEGRGDEGKLARGVADALSELRERGIYAIDAHEGNVGFVKDGDKVTYKLFDIGSSSPPARPKAETVDPEYVEMEQLALPGMLEEGSGAAEWVGKGKDALEPARAAQEAPRLASPPKYEAKGIRFTPIESGIFGGEYLSGFPMVRPQLLKHRNELPSLETVILSTIFAGLTVHTQIGTAEKSFRCVADRIRGGKLPTLADIDDCLVPLGLIKSRRAMYESASEWAPQVREAIKSGLRDRELRRHLYLTTETPHDIALAKLSFVLALLGQDCCCLDARILNRMFEREEANKLAHEFGRPPSERMLAKYEAVEDAFLANNAFYRPNDPIGRARCQWESWQAVGGAPARHDAWLHVVSGQ